MPHVKSNPMVKDDEKIEKFLPIVYIFTRGAIK
jgi:hypothetical protein